MRREILIWWKQAQEDLDSAEKIFNLSKWYLVAFLCEQAVEKALKGLIVKKTRNPQLFLEKHSLIYLGKTIKAPEQFYPILRELTRDYTVSRYPGAGSTEEPPYELYDEAKAKMLLEKTKEVLKWIETQLK